MAVPVMTTELMEDRDLALQLHRLLVDIDPMRWRADMATALRQKWRDLVTHLAQQPRYAELRETIDRSLRELDDSRARWLEFKKRLQPAYAELEHRLQAASIHVPSLRPTNYARSLMHLSSCAIAVTCIELLGTGKALLGIALAWAAFCWGCEIARRVSPAVNVQLMKFFGPFAHAHEAHRVNSATWYATALVLLALSGSQVLGLTGAVVLGIGDPIAGLIGRRFGKTRLLHGRSLEGTTAFFVSAGVVTFTLLALLHGATLGVSAALAIAAAGAFAGAIAELVSLRVDDNFSIPVSAAGAAWLVSALLHVA